MRHIAAFKALGSCDSMTRERYFWIRCFGDARLDFIISVREPPRKRMAFRGLEPSNAMENHSKTRPKSPKTGRKPAKIHRNRPKSAQNPPKALASRRLEGVIQGHEHVEHRLLEAVGPGAVPGPVVDVVEEVQRLAVLAQRRASKPPLPSLDPMGITWENNPFATYFGI